MRKLYIIGNGFDLHHGIECRYADFKKYCEAYDEEMVKHLERFHEDPEWLWSDFEAEMANLDADKLLGWATLLNPDWDTGWKGHYGFVDEVTEEVDYLSTLVLDFRDWALSLKVEKAKPMLDLDKRDSLFLNFNYTKTLETVYHVDHDRILYIHGVADGDFASLVVGHGKPEHEVRAKYESDNALEEEAREKIMELVAGWRKPTTEILARHEGFFNSLNDVEKIIVLGHSMAKVDLPYFQKVTDNVSPGTEWRISVFDERDFQRKQEATGKLKPGCKNVKYFRMEDISLYREGELFD